jgi:excisionase family DNA binding protein
MRIRDLATHPGRYLTVAELAEYWAVSRQQIYKRIESGALATIRFGVRCYRIPTQSALAFERRAQVGYQHPLSTPAAPPNAPLTRMPSKIGLQRVARAADPG